MKSHTHRLRGEGGRQLKIDKIIVILSYDLPTILLNERIKI